jgi:Tfp pilus assembly protein PilV
MTLFRGRTTLPADAGFALIEVIVSALILVLTSGAVIALLNSTGRAGAEERHKGQAFSVAQEDQARLRATRISDLDVAMKPRTVTLNGTPYTVTSAATFVSDKTGKTSCASGTTSSDYVKLSSKVTWPSMTSETPVTLESIVSPVSGSLDPTHGNLAVTIVNSLQQKISGAGLVGSGPAGFSGSTDSEGCALFGGEPAGNYTVTPELGSEYINFNGETPPPISTTISAGITTPLQLEYDRAGAVKVGFQVRNSSGAVVPSTADSIIAFNSGMKTAQTYGTPGGTPVSSIEAQPLYPFTSADSFYAGSCTTDSPTGEAGVGSVKVPAGGNATTTVQLPALYLTVKNSSGTTAEKNALPNARVTVTDRECRSGSTNVKRVYTTNSSGNLPDPGLPWSTYDLCASASISGTVRRTTLTNVPVESLNGTTQTMTLSTGSTTGACP